MEKLKLIRKTGLYKKYIVITLNVLFQIIKISFSFIFSHPLQLLIFIFAFIGLTVIIGHIFVVQNSGGDIFLEFANKDKPFYLINILVTIAALTTAIFTWWKNIINENQIIVQEDTRLDSLFAKAVEFLNEKNELSMRKGGVHILKDLAITSPNHAQKCIDMLCSLNDSWMPKVLTLQPNFFQENENFQNIKDLSTLLTYDGFFSNFLNVESAISKIAISQLVINSMQMIIKHISRKNKYLGKYDLSYKYLCSIDLSNLDLRKFDFNSINLQSSKLYNSNLQYSNLNNANFQHSNLVKANLKSSNLLNTNFTSANLNSANLKDAFIIGAKFDSPILYNVNFQLTFIQETVFENSYLVNSNFQFSSLYNTSFILSDVESANFKNCGLRNVHFRDSKNIEKALFGDNKKDVIFD